MGKEIERKFLIRDNSYRELAEDSKYIAQCYLSIDPRTTVRVRILGDKGYITVKGLTIRATRDEWEYEIPTSDAKEMMERCSVTPVLSKIRYYYDGWEIDEFQGALSGLVVAEKEGFDIDDNIELPLFIGREVTGDKRYYNSMLAMATECPPTE